MTPAERVVVEAAIRLTRAYYLPPVDHRTVGVEVAELAEATAALLAERADPANPKEQTLTWGQVAEGDEIFSPKTGRWYEVREAGVLGEGRSKIVAAGLPKPIRPKAADPVLVRRGETGLAVDMFASVLWSMPTTPSVPTAGAEPIPEVDAAHDPEASEPDA